VNRFEFFHIGSSDEWRISSTHQTHGTEVAAQNTRLSRQASPKLLGSTPKRP
jgi:hypothetical protein